MKTIKPQCLALLQHSLDDGVHCHLGVGALVFFRFGSHLPLPEVAVWPFVARELGQDTAIDLGYPKSRGELLITGKAYPSGGPQPACAVRATVGSIDKTLYVVGDRSWHRGTATDPQPFTEMPLTWTHAFGGETFAQNPLGKGMPLGSDHLQPLPNIEDPKHLVRSPDDRPSPAGFGPYDVAWPQRHEKLGTYDAAWLKERFPGLAKDFDHGYFNAAPIDQQMDRYFRGDEPFVLEHLHPQKAVIEGKLPGLVARTFVNQRIRGEVVFKEVAMHLDTVHLFPHVERGVLIFHGAIDVSEDDAADVLLLMAGLESLGAPKPVEHYRAVLRQRLDKDKGHLYALRDIDLMPAADPSIPPAPEDRSSMEALLEDDGLLRKHMRKRAEREHAKVILQMHAAGLDPAQYGVPLELPPEEDVPTSMDDLPEVVEQMEAKAEAMKADAERRKAEAEAQARAMCAEHGLDFDQIVGQAQAGGLPKFSVAEEFAKLEALVEEGRAAGQDVSGVEAMLADPDLRERLMEGEKRLREAYKQFAHHFSAAPKLDADAALRLREEVIAAYQAGQSLAGRELTGADLSNLQLPGVDLHGAFLEGADLSGANLKGADLREAVLARAHLVRTNLAEAKLAATNLGEANLAHADVTGGADMRGAVLAKADLSWTRFEKADLTDADFMETVFHETDLSGVKAPGASFLSVDLTGLRASGASLAGSSFIECTVEEADFSGANLVRTSFVTANASRSRFRGAVMRRVVAGLGSSFAGADFHGAALEGACLRSSNLSAADLSEAELARADFSECTLDGANLERANAREARFTRADLTGANLRFIDLMQGSIEKAIVRGADLEGANLYRADFAKTRGDDATNLHGANVNRVRIIPERKHEQG